MKRGPVTWPDYNVEPDQCDDNNDYCALDEILFLHYKKTASRFELELLLLFLVYACYRGPGNLENRLVSASDQEASIFNCSNCTDNAAGGDHSISDLQLRDR